MNWYNGQTLLCKNFYLNTLKYTILARLFTINDWFLFPGIFCAFMNWCNLLKKCIFVRKSFITYFTVERVIHDIDVLIQLFSLKSFFNMNVVLASYDVQVILESNFRFFFLSFISWWHISSHVTILRKAFVTHFHLKAFNPS